MVVIKRGEVWWIDFIPTASGEIQKTMPAVIVSNDYANISLKRVQVIPLTSNASKCYPCEAYVQLQGERSKAMADQIMTVSKQGLKSKISNLTEDDMKLIEQAIKVQLSLSI